jgi:inner membrane transporter RhtA
MRPPALALPIAAVITAMASFQVSAAFAKTLFPPLGPQGAVAVRLTVGALMLLALTRPWRAWPPRAAWPPLLGLGASVAVAVLFFYLAISRLPLGVAIALQFLGPLSVAVFGSRRALDLGWAGLAAVGVWVLVAPGGLRLSADPQGIGYALAAAGGWAGYILFGRVAGAALGPSTAALATSLAALIVLPFGATRAAALFDHPALIPLALGVALFSSVIPFSLELFAMPRMPARTFAVFTSIEPVFGCLSGLVLLHERLTLAQVAGVAAVICAAAGAAWSARATPTPPPALE